jgi:hypothetical protein
LKKSRASKRGDALVLKGEAFSPAVIADLAMTMLENCVSAPGIKLIRLLQELLDVDRHRRHLANERCDLEKVAHCQAAASLSGEKITGYDLAKLFSVSAARISNLRRTPGYREGVEKIERQWRENLGGLVKKIRTENPRLTEEHAYHLAFQMHFEEMAQHVPKIFTARVEGALSAITDAAVIEAAWSATEPSLAYLSPTDQAHLRCFYAKHKQSLEPKPA